MQPFTRDVLLIVVSAAAAGGGVLIARAWLIRLIASRERAQVASLVLLLLQLVIGFVIASIQFGEARTAGAFKSADLPWVHWLIPLSGVAVALQTLLLVNADAAARDRDELLSQIDLAKNDRNFATLISEVFLTVVSRKRERLKAIASREQLWRSLQPRVQIASLISACWEIFDSMAPEEVPEAYRLRVAYYRRAPHGLELAYAWNGKSSDCVPPRDERTRARFRFDHPDGCLAVAAASEGVMYRVADTTAAHAKRSHPFVFFDSNERNSLKSIAALPVKLEGESAPHGVLVVDTNIEGLFDPDDRRQELALQAVVENLAHRLHIEEYLANLIGGA